MGWKVVICDQGLEICDRLAIGVQVAACGFEEVEGHGVQGYGIGSENGKGLRGGQEGQQGGRSDPCGLDAQGIDNRHQRSPPGMAVLRLFQWLSEGLSQRWLQMPKGQGGRTFWLVGPSRE